MSLSERLWLWFGSEEFFPAPKCDHLGVSFLTFVVSFRCLRAIVSPSKSKRAQFDTLQLGNDFRFIKFLACPVFYSVWL